MAPHSSTLAWKIPWTEEPGRLQSMGSLRVRYDWTTSLSLFTFLHWRRKWQPTPAFLPGESQGLGSLVAAVYGVAQSRTGLKRLSSSSSKRTFMPMQYIWGSIFWSPSVSTYLILKKMTLPIVLLCPYFTLWMNSFSQCTRMCFFLCSA